MLANSALLRESREREAVAPDGFRETLGHSALYNPARGFVPAIQPGNTEFVVLSFEGPDPYARAGGLGVRVTELSGALAAAGFDTHLYFVGDPAAPPVEKAARLPLYYHRWCQWISRHHLSGVYDGEQGKLHDFRASVPRHLVEERIRPAVRAGRRVVVLSEEWHTADVACDLSDLLWREGVREEVVLIWNANNTLGFENIDFTRLRFTQAISTVSRWMKREMWNWGCNPIVIPNGVPARRLARDPLVEELTDFAQQKLSGRLTLGKVARFDPDKRWLMAVDAVANLKRLDLPVLFIAKGGLEAHGHDVIQRALARGLTVRDVRCDSRDPRVLMRALLDAAPGADMLNVQFYLSEPIARALFRVADAMLQNSGREPFGLVGLEVMAAGGLVVTGATGEEYARPWENAVVLDTDDPHEIEAAVSFMLSREDENHEMRLRGVETAARYTWDRVLEQVIRRAQYLALPR